MHFRFLLFFLCTLAVHSGHVLAETYELRPGLSDISMQDLRNLAFAVGVDMGIFDYEIAEDHCLHFFVEVREDHDPAETIDSRGVCSVGGPHRLTIQWREQDGELLFHFFLSRRDIRQGGAEYGPRIDVAGNTGWHGGAMYVVPPKLEFGERTALVNLRFPGAAPAPETGRPAPEWSKQITVLGELRENPEGIIGTE